MGSHVTLQHATQLSGTYNESVQTLEADMRVNADGSTGSESQPLYGAERLASVHRALRTLSAGNRTLLCAPNEQELLHDMCRVIVEAGGYRIASVGYAVHDEQKSIAWKAAVGTEVATLEEFKFTWGTRAATKTFIASMRSMDSSYVGRTAYRLQPPAACCNTTSRLFTASLASSPPPARFCSDKVASIACES